MKRLFAVVAAILLGTALAWMAGAHAISGAPVDRSWASDDFVRHLPHTAENESASRILADAERLGDLHSVRPALREVLHGKPPALAAIRFLDERGNAIRTLRAEIISSPPPSWASDPEEILDPVEPPFSLHLQLYTIFAADAAVQRERGNGRAAPADLRAIGILARSLATRPEVESLTIALIGYRIAGATPVDIRPQLLQAIEYDAWLVRTWAERYPAGAPDGGQLRDTVRRVATPFVRPIRMLRADLQIAKMHRMALAVAAASPSSPLPMPEMPEWAPIFQRINRLDAAPAHSASPAGRSPRRD